MKVKHVRNPMGFHIQPNQATPNYTIYEDFRSWLAYGLMSCWFGNEADPNAHCNMARPVTTEDVCELREFFIETVEAVISDLWDGDIAPGSGVVERLQNSDRTLVIGKEGDHIGDNDTLIRWSARLDDDSIMFEMEVFDETAIWLSYDALKDRENVLKVLTEARQYVNDKKVSAHLLKPAKPAKKRKLKT
jgi:hypothetical protein